MQRSDVHVYIFDGMADWEVGHAIAQINTPHYQKRPGRYRVRSVGPSRAAVRSAGGLSVLPDLALSELAPEHSALLILPGGPRWNQGRQSAALDKVLQLRAAGVPIAAICGATAGLARAGLLDHCLHTSNAREYLEQQPGYRGSGLYRDEPAVRDRGIITASALEPVAFARAIFQELDLYPERVLSAWHGLFATGDPRFYAELRQAGAVSAA